MQDLNLKAEFNQVMTGKIEWSWAVRQGVDDIDAFLKGLDLNTPNLVVPSQNLVGVDLKAITIAVKAKVGEQRYETEFQFNMHKKPSISFAMPDSIEAGAPIEIQINFDGSKLDRAEVYVMRVPTGGYQDPETGVVITEKDAKRQIEDVEAKNANKLYKKKSEAEERKEEKKAAGGADNELKRFRIAKSQFANGLKWWKKSFALKPSKQDFNVLLKLKACGNSGCFVKRKFLKVVKLSDANLEKFAAEKLTKFKSKDSVKTMDADEIADSLALLKEQGKSKKKTCKRGACEIKDKTGKKVDTAEVAKKDAARKAKAAEFKKEYEKKVADAKASGKAAPAALVCPKGKDDTGADVECSGFGVCTMGKKSGKARCACDFGFAGRACQFSEQEKEEQKSAKKNAISKMKEDAKAGKINSAKGQKDFLNSLLEDNDDEVDLDPEVADELVKSQKSYAEELRKKFKRRKEGKTDASDADFEPPTKEELADMMQQTMKLRKQARMAKLAKLDEAELDRNDTNATNGTVKVGYTAAERAAKKAEREAARAAKKEEMKMMRDLQAVQGTALLDEMKAAGKKTAVAE